MVTRVLVLGGVNWTDEDLFFDILSDYFHEQEDDELVVMFKPENRASKLVVKWAKASAKYGVRHGMWTPAQHTDLIIAFVADEGTEHYTKTASELRVPIQIHHEGE